MSWRNVGTVYRKELRDSLRDRRTVISMMIVVPVLLMPLLTIGVGLLSVALYGRAVQEIPAVMVLGGEDSPELFAALRDFEDIRIAPGRRDYAEEILNRRIRAAVVVPRNFDEAVARGDAVTVRIYMHEGELRSGLGA